MSPRPEASQGDADLRRRAEEKLRSEAPAMPQGDPRRIMHELQVHQIQLEMQNAELRDARTRLELLVEKYTDLYDFAPVGYFSLDASSRILEVNLTGAKLLGIERSRLLRRLFSGFVAAANRAALDAFLGGVFAGDGKQMCELALDNGAGDTIWIDLQGTRTSHPDTAAAICRLAVSDITALKRAEEAQKHVQELKGLNEVLEEEVSSRKITEKSLRASKRQQSRMLAASRRMQEQLRLLSHQILHVQEEERRRISVDLHDEVAQTLVAINVHLASLVRNAAKNNSRLSAKILETQKLVEQSVESVHRFAMDLRPTALDDLGLVFALRSYAKTFTEQTGIPVQFTATDELNSVGGAPAIALYRVAQAALSNVAQHAEASAVTLTLRQTQRSLRMEVTDDGKAFDPECMRASQVSDRLGLIGMRERTEMVGGRFSVLSSPGKGTTVRVTLPSAKIHQAISSGKHT
jgi:PAS domain S-box-containing protein